LQIDCVSKRTSWNHPDSSGTIRSVRVYGSIVQISASKFPNLPLYFTEWSMSYTPRDLVYDSYISTPYILSKLKATQGLVQGMSYWTLRTFLKSRARRPPHSTADLGC
jgi:beta-xylosidase